MACYLYHLFLYGQGICIIPFGAWLPALGKRVAKIGRWLTEADTYAAVVGSRKTKKIECIYAQESNGCWNVFYSLWDFEILWMGCAQKYVDLSFHKLPTQVAGLVSQSHQSFHMVLRPKQSLRQFLVEQLAIQKKIPLHGTIFICIFGGFPCHPKLKWGSIWFLEITLPT